MSVNANLKFRTIPVSLNNEQFEHLVDLALALGVAEDEFVQMAAVAQIDNKIAEIQRLKSLLGQPDEHDSEARLQNVAALEASRSARCVLDPKLKAQW